MRKFLMIAVPVLLILAVAVGVGSYRAMLKVQAMPSSSIKTIRDAVAEGNAATFSQLVDVDAVLETAATEIVTAYINDNATSMTYSTLEMQNLYNTLKPEFLAVAKPAASDYVRKGSVNFPAELSEIQTWLKDSRAETCAITGYSKIVKRDDGKAHTKIEFYNAALMFSFEIEVALEKVGENSWRVVSATGFDKYYSGVNRALKARLKDLNAPIQAEMDEFFDVKGFDAAVIEGDEYGFSRTLRLTVKAETFADKPIEKIGGTITIDGGDGKESTEPFAIYLDGKPNEDGVQTFIVDKVLNPFVRADANVMRHGLKKKDLHLDVTEITFSDGTSVKKFDALPE